MQVDCLKDEWEIFVITCILSFSWSIVLFVLYYIFICTYLNWQQQVNKNKHTIQNSKYFSCLQVASSIPIFLFETVMISFWTTRPTFSIKYAKCMRDVIEMSVNVASWGVPSTDCIGYLVMQVWHENWLAQLTSSWLYIRVYQF